MFQHSTSIAVIGAGIAGLTCARQLHRAGLQVEVFEKSRGVGGRVATRRADNGVSFDHGAQYFTVRDGRFQSEVDRWLEARVAGRWRGKIVKLRDGIWAPSERETERFVGVPGMTAIAKHLAEGVEVKTQMLVQQLERHATAWELSTDQGQRFGPYAAVLCTAPGPQSIKLLGDYGVGMADMQGVEIAPCWAVMLMLAEPLRLPWEGAFVEDSPLSWVARNSSKPGRANSPDCWVLHASPEWSRVNLEQTPDFVISELLTAFRTALALPALPQPTASAHRWRYALPIDPLGQRALFDQEICLGVGGDWCGGPRVEGAYLSGLALAEALLAELG